MSITIIEVRGNKFRYTPGKVQTWINSHGETASHWTNVSPETTAAVSELVNNPDVAAGLIRGVRIIGQ